MDNGSGQLTISVDVVADRVGIQLAGVMDAAGRMRFREQIRGLLGRGGCEVLIDVGELRAIDVPALAALLRADLLLRGVHSTMHVRAAPPEFVDLMRTTGLTGRLNVEPAVPAHRPAR
jgi:anti-sigma B factor antagonist